ncbi:MAG TPA: hypothetical protein VF314_14820 [Actinomycetes bacterium]
MTERAVLPQPVTARAALFGSEDATAEIAAAVREQGVVAATVSGSSRMSRGILDGLHHELAETVAGFLEVDLVELLAGAWRTHRLLTAAAARTAAASRTAGAPGAAEVVELASHTVTLTERPYVDLLLDGVRVGRVHLELRLALTVTGLVGVVRAGRLAALSCGWCDVDGTVTAEGFALVHRAARLDLPATVRLGHGIALLADRPGPPRRPGDDSKYPPPSN